MLMIQILAHCFGILTQSSSGAAGGSDGGRFRLGHGGGQSTGFTGRLSAPASLLGGCQHHLQFVHLLLLLVLFGAVRALPPTETGLLWHPPQRGIETVQVVVEVAPVAQRQQVLLFRLVTGGTLLQLKGCATTFRMFVMVVMVMVSTSSRSPVGGLQGGRSGCCTAAGGF